MFNKAVGILPDGVLFLHNGVLFLRESDGKVYNDDLFARNDALKMRNGVGKVRDDILFVRDGAVKMRNDIGKVRDEILFARDGSVKVRDDILFARNGVGKVRDEILFVRDGGVKVHNDILFCAHCSRVVHGDHSATKDAILSGFGALVHRRKIGCTRVQGIFALLKGRVDYTNRVKNCIKQVIFYKLERAFGCMVLRYLLIPFELLL